VSEQDEAPQPGQDVTVQAGVASASASVPAGDDNDGEG